MRRLGLALFLLTVPARAGPAQDRVTAAEARLVELERQRQVQQSELVRARMPLVRLMAGAERLALRPSALALAEPRSIDDLVHTHALLSALRPAIAARAAALRTELAQTREARAAAMRTLEEDAAGQGGLENALNQQLARLETPSLPMGRVASPEPAPYLLPAAGRVLIGTGERSESGWRARGLTLETRPGEAVKAPAAGRVGYAGGFGGYGAIVILDHGRGWMTLLTGLSQVEVRAGTIVAAAAPLGRMGSASSRLAVELRHYGRPVDVASMMAR